MTTHNTQFTHISLYKKTQHYKFNLNLNVDVDFLVDELPCDSLSSDDEDEDHLMDDG